MNPEDSSRSNYNLDQIYYDRASCFEKLGEFKLALADYTSILKLDSEQEEAYLYRGNCNARLGRWENALADYTLCIKHDIEPTAAPYLARAKAYEKLGKMESAKQDYQKANELKR